MSTGYLDGRADGRDPLDGLVADFDWQELFRLLNEPDEPQENRELACRAVRLLLATLIKMGPRPLNPASVGKRTICLAWCFDPGLFPGEPSLRQLAGSLGVTAATLAPITSEIRDKLHVFNRSQAAHDFHRQRFNDQKEETI